jgi:hypothetical protein
MKASPFFLFSISLASAAGITADENAMFADSAQITDSAALARNPISKESEREKKSVGLSGNILSLMQTGAGRSYFEKSPDAKYTSFGAEAVADAALDVRLLQGFKAFADLEWSYNPALSQSTATDSGASWRIPEIFVDANIAHRVYLRAGKQVLQWGRCYFFNPTDLVNVERKTFFQRIGAREGTYGVKAHVPFGTTWNLYGFLDTHDAQRPDSLTGAVKAEVLLGGTEMAVMIWDGGWRKPVYGVDLSTRFLDLDITGEAALYQSFHAKTLSMIGGVPLINSEQKDWVPRAAVGVGKSFRVSGIQDRLTTETEFYYNGPGTTASRMGLSSLINSLPSAGSMPSNPALNALTLGFYEPNSYSRYYAAFFATFNRFIRSDMALTFNVIGNLDQRCALISTGVAYQNLNDFSLTFYVQGFAGPEDTEYTLSEQAVQLQLLAQVVF